MGKCHNFSYRRLVNFNFCILVFFAACLNGFSQKKNAVVLEFGGKAFSYYDISYERYLGAKLHLGVGLGFEGASKAYSQKGLSTELDFRIPVYAAWSFGKKKSHVMTELGVTLEEQWHTGLSLITDLWPFISGGYEYRGEKIIIRVPVYLVYVGPNAWFPPVLPWVGLSLGMPF